MAALVQCPICRRTAPPRSENAAAPFCSPRCKQLDLGNWLNESYRVPLADEPDTIDDANAEEGS